jgi:hypothetical protein
VRRRVRLALGVAAVAGVWLVPAAPALAAPWCGTVGTEDRPATVGGAQVRVIYAIPSDGEDRSATIVPQLSADVDAIEDWWRGQDPTRTARFDRAPFPCGLQADVQLFRATQTAEQLRLEDRRFEMLADAITTLDSFSPFYKYLVYYDGPLESDRLCGQGGGFFDGPGVAIVYLGSCAGEPSVVIAAHELIHSMGMLPRSGPPHACPESPGHACDTQSDIMWPFATLVPLSSLLLDVNRDDYYGHAGGWEDLQDSRWLRHLDAQVPLALTLQGTGSVVSDVPGIDCSASCASEWDAGSAVVLAATATPNQRFVGWSGACAGSAPSCSVSLAQPAAVTALFAPLTFGLRVTIAGKGTVRSAFGEVACPGRCRVAVSSYTPIRLTAKPAKGWRFKTWSGACRGTRASCALPMTAAAQARAVFARAKPR